MQKLNNFLSNLKRIDLYAICQEWFDLNTTNDLVVKLQQEQLYSGVRSDNSEITPPYTSFTEQTKIRKGQPFDRVTLKDTGAFYESINLSITKQFAEIFATDPKTNDLQEKYGENILGLTPENIEILRKEFYEYLMTKLRQTL